MLLNLLNEIIANFQEKINKIMPELCEYLLKGRMLEFEKRLSKEQRDLYNALAVAFLCEVAKSEQMKAIAKTVAQKKGLGPIEQSKVEVQLKTGETVEIPSWYAKSPKKKRRSKRGPNGSGCHVILAFWGCIQKATPSYFSFITMLSVLCPSFEIVMEVLKNQQIKGEYKRIREISYAVGAECFKNRVKIGLREGETLSGKRVIISVDGGRIRTRVNNPNKEPSKNYKGKREKFDTPWREPKLFVIHTIAEDGFISKTCLPLYDCTITKPGDCFGLLSQYLQALQIDKATQILFIADGASWIWKRAKSMFLSLGVSAKKIVEAIDYYHAVGNLSEVVSLLAKLSDQERLSLFAELKNDLWNGNIQKLVDKITALAKGRKRILNKLEYFRKNSHRMQYQSLRDRNLPCGSGIVESAIRRIINLRFKSPGTFWNVKNVEKLIFLRAIFLAGRWDILISNLSTKNHGILNDIHNS